MSDLCTDASYNKIQNKHKYLLKKYDLENSFVDFWVFNAIFGSYGDGVAIITPEFVTEALKTRSLIIPEDLAKSALSVLAQAGHLYRTRNGYKRGSLL